jgi:hypothetical protein
MSFPNIDPKLVFGEDLIQVFGPRSTRRHISTLTASEKRTILNKIPTYVPTDDLGNRPSFFQLSNKILSTLQQTQALVGIDLDWQVDLFTNSLHRPTSAFIRAENCYKNNKSQRGIFLKHLVEDILFVFDPTMFLTGLARKLSDGTFNLNDAQHRNVAGIILGIRDIPADSLSSDLESVDIDQYAAVNLNSLAASDFDYFRIRVMRNKARKAEGRTDLDPYDIAAEEMYELHLKYGSKFIEKGGDRGLPLECTGVGIMKNYFEHYGATTYERALSIVVSVFSKAQLSTANCWGLMEFITEQMNAGVLNNNPQLLDFRIAQSIFTRYSDQSRSGMHLDIKRAFEKGSGKELDIAERRKIAAGIWKICTTINPEIDWAPIKFNDRNIADYLKEFRVMPVTQAA